VILSTFYTSNCDFANHVFEECASKSIIFGGISISIMLLFSTSTHYTTQRDNQITLRISIFCVVVYSEEQGEVVRSGVVSQHQQYLR